MLKSKVFEFYGGGPGIQSKVADVLKISRQAVSSWPDLVPFESAEELEFLTAGHLKIERKLYREHRKRKRFRKKKKAAADADRVQRS